MVRLSELGRCVECRRPKSRSWSFGQFGNTSTVNRCTVEDRQLIDTYVVRVEGSAGAVPVIFLAQTGQHKRAGAKGTLLVAWQKPPSKRRREILLPSTASSKGLTARPIRSETRATLVASIARGRRWLDELISDPVSKCRDNGDTRACSIRKVNMMISLAFLAPHLVKAAIEGNTASRDGRRPSLRFASRMVSPKPNASALLPQ